MLIKLSLVLSIIGVGLCVVVDCVLLHLIHILILVSILVPFSSSSSFLSSDTISASIHCAASPSRPSVISKTVVIIIVFFGIRRAHVALEAAAALRGRTSRRRGRRSAPGRVGVPDQAVAVDVVEALDLEATLVTALDAG
ncbi:hypothetical protein B0T26DRAFT_722788 [Lasiosphaeria miniovina]|uniref:Uncharacterized protein n=1 Tax=Lasiosphaeria miniovina TaxID=1954250 RepID=A0AA40A5J3_9PEZI|nr:uncharacterized protein B0T26DRAFT_722788 [Lasiosphaeria miniovina]KAK0709736.1 hypothetical protein B0T26DRAFT_722788 [Lasiosphaeria miniovina]